MRKKILFFSFCLCFIASISANAAEQIRLGVMPFLIRTSALSGEYSTTVSDMVIKMFQASPSISVIERERLREIAMEQGLNVNSNNDASIIKLGQVAGCQYMLLGSIVEIAKRYSSNSFSFNAYIDTHFSSNEKYEYRATLEARLVDVATSRVVLSFSKSGNAQENGNEVSPFFRALEAVSSRLVDEVRKALAKEYAMIISVNKNNVRINRGRSSGVNVGALYKVYQEGEELFDLNGKSLGKRVINLALLHVTNVNDNFSNAEILRQSSDLLQKQNKNTKSKKSVETSKSKKTKKSKKESLEVKEMKESVLIREGDKIEAISFSEAEKLKLSSKRIGE